MSQSYLLFSKSLVRLISTLFLVGIGSSSFADEEAPQLALPSAKQIRFADWEVGAFFHFNINPFSGYEHSDGQPPASMFAPTEVDTDQWARTAKAMGARYAVLTARHEGGFCLWPSASTNYSVANSPWRDGKGDLVREFVESCRKYDLAVGLYHTAGFDAHEALKDWQDNLVGELKPPLSWGNTWGKAIGKAMRAGGPAKREAFKQTQLLQMRELLTNYGQIDFMWSDHWNATDPNGVWRAVTLLAEELQPNMVFMGTDTWVPGNETGHVVYPMWNAVDTKDGTRFSRPSAESTEGNSYGLLEGDVSQGSPLGKYWRVRECTTNTGFHFGGWFWHPDEHTKTAPRRTWEHLDLYYRTVGLGANTIINLPVDTRGIVPEEFVAAAKALGDEIAQRFETPIAETNGISTGKTVELSWDKPQEFNTIVTMENIATGQKVVRYALEAWVDGKWQPLEPRNRLVASPPYSSNPGFLTIGHKKIDRVAPVTTNKVRFRCLEAVADSVEIRRLAVYNCPPIVRTFEQSYPALSGVDTIFDEGHRGLSRDLDYEGGPLEIGGKQLKHGLFIHPGTVSRRGVAIYDLAAVPDASGFTALVGIEDHAGKNGSCVFIAQAMVAGEWMDIFRSTTLRGADPAKRINVAFPEGATQLKLLVTDAGDGVGNDHAVWGEAIFTED